MFHVFHATVSQVWRHFFGFLEVAGTIAASVPALSLAATPDILSKASKSVAKLVKWPRASYETRRKVCAPLSAQLAQTHRQGAPRLFYITKHQLIQHMTPASCAYGALRARDGSWPTTPRASRLFRRLPKAIPHSWLYSRRQREPALHLARSETRFAARCQTMPCAIPTQPYRSGRQHALTCPQSPTLATAIRQLLVSIAMRGADHERSNVVRPDESEARS